MEQHAMIEQNVEHGAMLLLVAGLVAMLTRRVQLPYSVGLVAAGIVLTLLPFSPALDLTRELLFVTLLPPLIFEAAFYLHWNELRRNLGVILVLATAGVALSTAITSTTMHFLVDWPWASALVFGVLISATDPVSVIAMFKEAGVKGRLRLLVEAESLFNDGTAAVGFAIAATLATGSNLSSLQMAGMLFSTAFGGILSGAAVGGALLLLMWRTTDYLVELTFTTIAAYGSFLLAEHFHFSGVLATLTTGLMMGNLGPMGALSTRGREGIEGFWEFAAFVANSFVFLLIGIREGQQHILAFWPSALAAIAAVTLGRAAAIYPGCLPFQWSGLRVTTRHQHIMVWGGLRGALALALALGLPPEVPRREDIISVSFAVVAFSVFVQGLTIKPLMRKYGEIR